MEEVRVRFAPSPTGFLHVGGARTAIFNWLYAKNRKGKFLLRIEDTDAGRSRSELSAQIIRSMEWLGMVSDEPIVYQSDRIKRYKEIAKRLIEEKKAYYAFETTEELEVKRKAALASKTFTGYDRSSLKYDRQTIRKFIDEGKPYSVRFFVPEGMTEFNDLVHGGTKFQNSEIEDFIILRSDGSPVYQIAVVVDDHDMNISHVIRGDDHLPNTPKQILLYKSLGWNVPEFAHLPMILDEQKKKLSKRRDTVSAEEYKELGYLPEALFNFLTLLGFAPPDNKEIITRNELVKMFNFDRVNKRSAVFDIKKLKWINSEYIKREDEKIIAEMIREKLISQKILSAGNAGKLSLQYLLNVIGLMKERASTINDFVDLGRYFFIEPVSFDEKGLQKHWDKRKKELMNDFLKTLKEIPESDFNSKFLEDHLRKFAEQKGVKAAEIIHPLRLAVSGASVGPGLFDLLEMLGKDTCERRIENLVKKF
jgi:glutamyl-tRNA synthetase